MPIFKYMSVAPICPDRAKDSREDNDIKVRRDLNFSRRNLSKACVLLGLLPLFTANQQPFHFRCIILGLCHNASTSALGDFFPLTREQCSAYLESGSGLVIIFISVEIGEEWD